MVSYGHATYSIIISKIPKFAYETPSSYSVQNYSRISENFTKNWSQGWLEILLEKKGISKLSSFNFDKANLNLNRH